jgi:hypothetical protein
MRRWASGFFQNFQAHRDQVVRSPASFLVVGSLLLDLLTLPVTYTLVALWALHDAGSLRWLVPCIAIHALITTFIASRTITWKQAIIGFPCYWIANWWNKAIYLGTFFREWVLGRHYVSWTGRQGRATEITPMSRRRKTVFAAVTASVALVGIAARSPLPTDTERCAAGRAHAHAGCPVPRLDNAHARGHHGRRAHHSRERTLEF